MAAAAVLPASSATPKPSWTPIIDQPNESKSQIGTEKFNAKNHLNYVPPSKIYSMKDLSLPEDQGISPVAVSEPFPLFSEECIMRMRKEILSDEVFDNCQYSSNFTACQLRGFANKYTPFTYDVWKSPEVLSIVSKIAGIDLVTQMDVEIATINISVKSEKDKEAEVRAFHRDRAQYEADEGIAGCPWEDDEPPIVSWHTDSYPFVCVTMLSDCTNMIGGETALKTGTGEIMKVRGPQMGCAVVLQGRYIEHQALRTLGTSERISMVTSFRPRSPFVKDDTVLTTTRTISDRSELYHQFAAYRLEILEERIRRQLKEMRAGDAAGRFADTRTVRGFIKEQSEFLSHMVKEMIIEGEEKCDVTEETEDGDSRGKKRARN